MKTWHREAARKTLEAYDVSPIVGPVTWQSLGARLLLAFRQDPEAQPVRVRIPAADVAVIDEMCERRIEEILQRAATSPSRIWIQREDIHLHRNNSPIWGLYDVAGQLGVVPIHSMHL
ncbi:MAG: hypothetical protein FJ304_27915 [Planctomycetes bacterium]|nr:hypothetical protein [Planctomycetota bacterium]